MANNAKNKKTSNGGRSKPKPTNNGGGNGGGTQNFRGITQSTARSVTNPFGGNASPAQITKGLDAFDSCHVPLPRAIGDYTVVRTTQIVNYADNEAGKGQLSLYGPMKTTDDNNGASYDGAQWSATMGLALSDAGGVGTDLCRQHVFNAQQSAYATVAPSWSDVRLTPASFSVKIMNPEALQTSSGVVYIGRCRQMLNRGGSSSLSADLANDLVSYSQPELCAAGRLALRGVQVNSVPYDMNSLSDFRPLNSTGRSSYWKNDLLFDGLAPIFVYNPSGIDLQLLICCEWRVRFDPSNPAYATHTFHRASTMEYWEKVQRLASSEGAGVFDLAEKSNPSYLINRTMPRSKRMI